MGLLAEIILYTPDIWLATLSATPKINMLLFHLFCLIVLKEAFILAAKLRKLKDASHATRLVFRITLHVSWQSRGTGTGGRWWGAGTGGRGADTGVRIGTGNSRGRLDWAVNGGVLECKAACGGLLALVRCLVTPQTPVDAFPPT